MRTGARVRLGLATAVALLTALLAAGVVRAAPEPTVLKVTIEEPQVDGQGYSINAQITTAAGKPVNGVTLNFYVLVDLFGPHQMLIGTASTDGQGRASVRYSPSWKGQHDVIVKFAGSTAFAPAEGQGSFISAVAIAPYESEQLPLARFSEKLPYAVGAVVLGVWLTIGFALVSTVWAALGARRHEPEAEPAPQRVTQEAS